jgi:hypothetical protein
VRHGTAFLLLALALSACSRHPTYGRPTPRDTTPADDPPPKTEVPLRPSRCCGEPVIDRERWARVPPRLAWQWSGTWPPAIRAG